MKKKIAAGALIFLFFIAMVTAIIFKDAENRKEFKKITGNTIGNGLESDSGMRMDEIAAEFSEYAMTSAGYKNIADIAYAKTDSDIIHLVFTDCDINNAFYLATRLIDESGGKILFIIWSGDEYEVNKENARNNEELADMFPDEWAEIANKAFFEDGLQISAGDIERIESAIIEFINLNN